MLILVGQLFDYFVKAAVAYGSTPEGEKELQDILDAAEGTYFDATEGDEPLTVQQVKQTAGRVARAVRVKT